MDISFSNEKRAVQVGFQPTTYSTTYEADVLPTELPRQLSWPGRIKAIHGQPVQDYCRFYGMKSRGRKRKGGVLVAQSNHISREIEDNPLVVRSSVAIAT